MAEIDPDAEQLLLVERLGVHAGHQAEQPGRLVEAPRLQLDAAGLGEGKRSGGMIAGEIRGGHGAQQSERRVAILPAPGMDDRDLAAGQHDLGEIVLGDGCLPRQIKCSSARLGSFSRLNTMPLRRSTRGRSGESSAMASISWRNSGARSRGD